MLFLFCFLDRAFWGVGGGGGGERGCGGCSNYPIPNFPSKQVLIFCRYILTSVLVIEYGFQVYCKKKNLI